MKSKLGVPEKRALADFLPSVTIKAKDLATEITNVNIKKNSRMKRELDISSEHIKNNKDVRSLLAKNDIIPEDLPVAEDVKKVQRRLNSEGKKLSKGTKKLKG
jgi:DNA-damage-inducible protein D